MFYKSAPQILYPEDSLGFLVKEFLTYITIDLRFSPGSIAKYRECLDKVMRLCGTRPANQFDKSELNKIKTWLYEGQFSASRQVSILLSLKRFLRFLVEERDLRSIDPTMVKVPRIPRRQVDFLTVEEVSRFVSVISIENRDGSLRRHGLRFRALVEILLGSAMRISEALSLNKSDIDFVKREALVAGKGNKQRSVFFTLRAIYWLDRYLKSRDDHERPLFLNDNGARMKKHDLWRPFKRYRDLAGINKKITPHILRHTAATQLLFNGCPIGHIKQILGHERLETTCRYYLGLDNREAKNAHSKFLHYDCGPGDVLSVASSQTAGVAGR